jgi:hypothetical protein
MRPLWNKTPPPVDARLKAFVIICECEGASSTGADHDANNKSCPVEIMMKILFSMNVGSIVHDIIDIQPFVYYEEGSENVKHDEVTE